MTALRTRLGRPKELFSALAIGLLCGASAYMATYHVLVVTFRTSGS